MIGNLIIGGVHKAGTTSLFSYLMDHPEICGSTKKEIHHYTPLRYKGNTKSLDHYNSFFSHCPVNAKYMLDASPSYLYGNEKIAERLFGELENPKILFVLRDPVKRFISYYKHCEGKFIIPRNTTFKEFYSKNLKNYKLQDIDDPFFRGLREGIYIDYLRYWIANHKSNIKVLFFEDLIDRPKESLNTICEWINIEANFYENYNFKVENKTSRYGNKYLHQIGIFINGKFEYFFRINRTLKTFLKKWYSKINVVQDIYIDDDTKDDLRIFYSQKNNELKDYLIENGYLDLPRWLTKKRIE
ncbi:sulfotransferase [uncultured Eudoraea sp.]|uniref:sulfotransferase family protein n=1 Tax=uncultured Eudoraea sp. TaxID=1035614 RepID=UPI002627616F|nr:sulfotransferase [uncultured Eudoraea sp.]